MSLSRLAVALILVGMALLLCDFRANRLVAAFRGEMRVAKDRSESVAITPSSASANSRRTNSSTHQYAVPAAEIPFDDPLIGNLWVDPSQAYDVFHLPFSLSFVQSIIRTPATSEDRLRLQEPGATEPREISLHAGDTINLSGVQAHVDAIRPWAGLLRHPSGAPSANVAVRTPNNEWLENLILGNGSWLRAGSDLAIHLVWHTSEQDARAAIDAEAKAPKTESARWGVVDGGGVNWQDSLIPGSGLTLRDDTVVFLVQVDLQHDTNKGKNAAILLQIVKKDTRTLQWVMANADEPDAQYRFDYPATRDMVFVLHAWQDTSCIATAALHYQTAGATVMQEGASWTPKGAPYTLRLDQLISTGIPVTAQQSPLSEVVLSTPTRAFRIRQDETITVADAQISFLQHITPPSVDYEFRVNAPDSVDARTVVLKPGQTLQIQDVQISQGSIDPKNLGVATLAIAVQPDHLLAVASLGPCLMGLVLLIQIRRTKQR